MTKYSYEDLGRFVEEHHLRGQPPDTCDIDAAYALGHLLLAARWLVSGTHEVSPELEEALAEHDSEERYLRELAEFRETDSYECVRCGAKVWCWDGDYGPTDCHGCGSPRPEPPKVPDDEAED